MTTALKKLAAVPPVEGEQLAAPSKAAARERAGSLRLVRVVARQGDLYLVRCGRDDELVGCDPSVDPALIEGAIASGARVVVEDGPPALIVGALATARTVAIDGDGAIRLAVTRFEVTAEEALLKTRSAFVSVRADEVEIFGRRILSRARELARVLARVIQLN